MNKLKIKNNKLKFLIVVLVFFLSFFFVKYKDTFSIYRGELNTRIYLTITDPSTTFEVTFDQNYGNNISSIFVGYNQQVGTLPTPTRTDYNFLGWYDDPTDNTNRIYSDEIITGPVTFYAHWQKIICKKVTNASNLHTETCLSGGCRVGAIGIPANSDITYGTVYGQGSPIAGDAYNCDVNDDGTFDAQTQYGKFTERFYFLRQIDNGNDETTGALVYYTSIDSNGPVDSQHNSSIGSTNYNDASAWLPTSSSGSDSWDNPGLIDFDSGNGKISRFLNFADLSAVCGPVSGEKGASYFADCGKWFLFENSRFQSTGLGRAGIWLEHVDNTYYRIQTQTVQLAIPQTGANSDNTARPVIEIPMSAFEGFKNVEKYIVNFDTHGGTPEIPSIRRYSGDLIGTLETPTLEHYVFAGWYAESTYNTLVTAETIVTGDMTLHAKWTPKPTSTITLNANGGAFNGESTYSYIVDTGDTVDADDFPEPVYEGYSLVGWYTDQELTIPFDDTNPITESTLTLYASWEVSNYVARVNGQGYETLAAAIVAVPEGTSSPTTVTILKNITLEEAITIPNNKWVELDGGNYTISGSLANLITNNGKLNIISGTITTPERTTATTLITNGGSGTLNISGGTLTNPSSNGTLEFLTISNVSGGTVNISGGTLNSYGQSASINVKSNNSKLNVSGGQIIAHSVTKGQAIYMEAGTVTISGDAYLENVSGTGESRACVDNNGGTLNITGGTIVSKGFSAVIARKSGGKVVIGNADEIIDITTPVMRGKIYGLNVANGTVNVYDGIFESSTNTTAYNGSIAATADNLPFINGTTTIENVTYYTTYLQAPSVTVYFYEEINSTPISVTVDNGVAIGSDLPTVTKQGYYFDGWYIDGNPLYEVTSSTKVFGTFNAYAKWVRSVTNATCDDPMNIEINTSSEIVFNESDIESVTYLSSNSSIASVDSDGTVHGIAVGSVTITMTGSKSGLTKQITVNITPVMRTVTFTDSKHETITRTVADGTSLDVNMPANPTDSNYVFSGWTISGELTPFTSSSQVNDDITVVANWQEKVNYATLTSSPTPMNLVIGNNGQITLSATGENDTIEDFSVESTNPSVATATKNGNVITVNALDYGTTTIRIIGRLSTEVVPISVSVDYLKHTVTFRDDINPDIEIEVIDGTMIGASNMPADPVKEKYLFDGWVKSTDTSTAVDANTVVNNDIIAIATWTPTIQNATIPLTHVVTLGSSNTIPITDIPTGMESYTFSSSDSTVVSVNSTTGEVTGLVLGTADITITGSRSNVTKTVHVTVSEITYTVTFMNDNSATPVTTVSVAAGNSLGNNMPADLSETNYIFKGWTISGELTPFTSSSQVTDNITVVANWRLELNSATINKNPDPLTFKKGKTGEITLVDATNGRLVENCTFSSSNTNIAEVTYSNNVASVFGADYGEITVTITGGDSNVSRTVQVIINNINNITFDPDNGNTNDITTIQVADGGSVGTNVPANPTYSGYTFDYWYLYDETNETLTTTMLDPSDAVTSDAVYKARWAGANNVAAIGTNYFTTIQLAIDSVATSGTAEIRILKDVSPSDRTTVSNSKDITINANGHELSCSNGTEKNLLYANGGKLRVKNGTFTCNKSGNATFETSASGELHIYDGAIVTNTNNRGAVYNVGKTYIYGGHIESSTEIRSVILNNGANSLIEMYGGEVIQTATSTSDKGQGALQVEKGTVKVFGGTVISKSTNTAAIDHSSSGTLIIGTDDKDNSYDATNPVIQGEQYGVYAASGKNYSIFDGIIKGKAGTYAVNSLDNITATEANTEIVHGIDGDYKTLYYTVNQEKYRINFDAGDGTVSPSYLEYNVGSSIDGSNFPEPTRTNYTFDGWYTDSNFQTPFATFTPSSADVVTYYAKWSSKYRINFNAGDGTVSPSYLEYNVGSTIDGSNFPEPTLADYTFGGWYLDSNFQTQFASFTPNAPEIVTYYAKWTYNSSFTPVSHNILSPAMQEYFSNVSSWVSADATDSSNPAEPYLAPQTKNNYDNGHHLFKDSISSVFTTNGCSSCQNDNSCTPETNKTYCDQQSEYDTGLTDNLNVYLYENGQKGSQVTYVTSTGGKIYNMIPGVTYLWESATDNTKYGVVTATGSRRTLKTSIRNLRDLGGLAASNSDVSGTIDYGRLYRGAQIETSQGVTDLNKLGVTREVDLRQNGDGIQSYKLDNYDTGIKTSYNDIIITNYIINPAVTDYIKTAYPTNYRNVKSAMREIMKKVVFNHDSIFFHCTIGTDRTGTIAYFLEGLLGVSEEDRLRDYEMTYFFGLTNRTRFHDTSSWSNTAPRFYSMYRSYPTNQDIYDYYTFETHTPDPNDPTDLSDDELLRRFRLELIH